jgi:hypothetical protein
MSAKATPIECYWEVKQYAQNGPKKPMHNEKNNFSIDKAI